MYRNGIKRLLAVILSLCGMIVLSPLLLILCIAIKVDSPGPILFKQKRVGIHKQHFNILKFRTMRMDTPHDMPTHMLRTRTSISRGWGIFCAKRASMSCPSCGISSWATWRSSARVRRCGTSMTCWPSATNTGPTMSAPA